MTFLDRLAERERERARRELFVANLIVHRLWTGRCARPRFLKRTFYGEFTRTLEWFLMAKPGVRVRRMA